MERPGWNPSKLTAHSTHLDSTLDVIPTGLERHQQQHHGAHQAGRDQRLAAAGRFGWGPAVAVGGARGWAAAGGAATGDACTGSGERTCVVRVHLACNA